MKKEKTMNNKNVISLILSVVILGCGEQFSIEEGEQNPNNKIDSGMIDKDSAVDTNTDSQNEFNQDVNNDNNIQNDVASDVDLDVDLDVDSNIECIVDNKKCEDNNILVCKNNEYVLDKKCVGDNSFCLDGQCVQCLKDENCFVNNDCLISVCSNNFCSFIFADNGVPCTDGLCNGSGLCFSCNPGEKVCDNDVVLICNAVGKYEQLKSCSIDNKMCVEGTCVECASFNDCDNNNECMDVSCVNNICLSLEKVYGEVCNNNSICNGDGQCLSCVPGAKNCIGSVSFVCNSLGVWEETVCSVQCVGGNCVECVYASDCGSSIDDCKSFVCINNACVMQDKPLGSPCVSGTCDNSGVCQPIPVVNQVLWLSADSNVDKTTSDKVTSWSDKSSLSHVASQTYTDYKPSFVENSIKGKPTIKFDGNNDCLSLTNGFSDFSNGLSAFFVVKIETINGWGRFLEFSSNDDCENQILFGRWTDSKTFIYGVVNEPNCWCPTCVTVSHDIVVPYYVTYISVIQTGTQVNIYLNGSITSVGTVSVPVISERTTNRLGCVFSYGDNKNFFKGHMAEIILYNRSLTNAERVNIDIYLMDRWL
jgi:hypothetical protein